MEAAAGEKVCGGHLFSSLEVSAPSLGIDTSLYQETFGWEAEHDTVGTHEGRRRTFHVSSVLFFEFFLFGFGHDLLPGTLTWGV
jgi:hypothetical protein